MKHFPVLYFYHCGFNLIGDLQNVRTRNTTSLIKKTITFEENLIHFFDRCNMVNICKLRKSYGNCLVLVFKMWWFVFKVPHNPSGFFMHDLHDELNDKSELKVRQIRIHFCFFLSSNWSCSMYTHFLWNKFLHGSLEFIIDSCNSRFALSSIADIRSSVPLVINSREQLVVLVGKQNESKQMNSYIQNIINKSVCTNS